MNVFILLIATSLAPAWAGTEGMPQMPLIQPKKTTVLRTVEEGRALLEDRGFGAREDEVGAMNLMMVEGADTAGDPAGAHSHGGHGAHSNHGTGHSTGHSTAPAPKK